MFERIDDILGIFDRNMKLRGDEKWDLTKKEDREMVLMVEVRAVELLCEIFNSNEDLCRKVENKVIERCCDFLIDTLPGDEMRYLRFLQIIIVHSKSTVTKKRVVQIMMDKLLDRDEHFVLSDLPNEDNKIYFTRLVSLFAYGISTDRTWGEFTQHEDDDTNENDPDKGALITVIVRLQGALNIDWLLDEIEHLHVEGWVDLEASYLRLLNAMYLHHSHLHASVIDNYAMLFKTMERLIRELSKWMSLNHHGTNGYKNNSLINKTEINDRLEYSVMPCVYAFFRYVLPKSPMGVGQSLDKFVQGLKVWVCTLTRRHLEEPVLAPDGHTYEKEYITRWLHENDRISPETNMQIPEKVKRKDWAQPHTQLAEVMEIKGAKARKFAETIVNMRHEMIDEYADFVKVVKEQKQKEKSNDKDRTLKCLELCFPKHKKQAEEEAEEDSRSPRLSTDSDDQSSSGETKNDEKVDVPEQQRGQLSIVYSSSKQILHEYIEHDVEVLTGAMASAASEGMKEAHDAVNSAAKAAAQKATVKVNGFLQEHHIKENHRPKIRRQTTMVKSSSYSPRQTTMVTDITQGESISVQGEGESGNKLVDILPDPQRYFELLSQLIKKSEKALQVSEWKIKELNKYRMKMGLGEVDYEVDKPTLEKFFVFELQKMEKEMDPKYAASTSHIPHGISMTSAMGSFEKQVAKAEMTIEQFAKSTTEMAKNTIEMAEKAKRDEVRRKTEETLKQFSMKGGTVARTGMMTVTNTLGERIGLKKAKKKLKIDPLYPEFKALVGKMINHVTQNLLKEIHSGFDTQEINRRIMLTLTAFLQDRKAIYDKFKNNRKRKKHAMEEFERIQGLLAECGSLSVVLKVLSHAKRNDEETITAALELGKLLLEFGNKKCQDKIKEYFAGLSIRKGHEFFYEIHEHIRDLQKQLVVQPKWIKNLGQTGNDWVASKQVMLLRFLQLWAEGHRQELQHLLRAQDFRKSFNILNDVVISFDKLTQQITSMGLEEMLQCDPLGLKVIEQHLEFLIECLQGPCEENQDYVINETRLPLFVKRYVRFHRCTSACIA